MLDATGVLSALCPGGVTPTAALSVGLPARRGFGLRLGWQKKY
jgi:hypothetical protein